ncbi:DsbE family thiol:disulfide interchange protein [Photobacterium nomapromontoriensis]|uniref:DsbE family thiol:disulfide interchange protein n=1 Tax=Photobacterium nomapromontoriensis TaxID=2910237 RepID=UPI003D119B64
MRLRIHQRLLPLLITSVLLGMIALAMLKHNAGSGSGSGVPTLANKPMPEFRLDQLDGQEVADQSLFMGDLTLLNVWASWCGICKSEHGLLMSLAEQNAIRLVGLNYRDDRLAAKQELQRSGNPYQTVLYDPKGILAIDLGVYGTPESYLVDGNGMIRYRYVGALDEQVWQQAFLPVLQRLKQPELQGESDALSSY